MGGRRCFAWDARWGTSTRAPGGGLRVAAKAGGRTFGAAAREVKDARLTGDALALTGTLPTHRSGLRAPRGGLCWGTSKTGTTPTSIWTSVRAARSSGRQTADADCAVDHPLADGFSLTQGSVQFKVPHVSPSNNYIVVCE